MVDENVRKTIQQALQNDGVWDIIDGSQSQFFEVGHPYTHLVLTDAALYEKVLESMRALKRNSAKNLGYIVRSRWDIVAVEYKGPYYDSTGNLRTASEINVTLKSGARIQRVRVAVTYMASRALQEWTGAAENDYDRHKQEMAYAARKYVEILLSGRGRDNSWDPLWQQEVLEISADVISWIRSQVGQRD
jgi:hypothetical protein